MVLDLNRQGFVPLWIDLIFRRDTWIERGNAMEYLLELSEQLEYLLTLSQVSHVGYYCVTRGISFF